MHLPRPWLAVLLLLVPPLSCLADARPGGLPANTAPGELKVLKLGDRPPDAPLQLPLQHTDVRISVSGFVARATVTQHYTNPFEQPIEAVYTFPLPDQAAVDGMTMHIGDKVIRGLIKRRDEAREIYERAKAAGKRTGLLEQERPNIFTQSVGNIMPGDAIEIEITYVDILRVRDEGAFELVFPMVVGPRYIPGRGMDKRGPGGSPDTDLVPDASRITPPVLKPGQRSGHDIRLQVDLDAVLPIHGVHSVSHAVDIEDRSASRRAISLHPSDTLPNKDFVLRWQVAGKAPEVALITHHEPQRGGFFTLLVMPQQQVTDEQAVPRDLIFILDTSGSMRGAPLQQSKQAMAKLIDGMRPSDRFNVVRFAGDTGTLWSEPKPNTPENAAAARRFVEQQRGAGGTEMRSGIIEALAQSSDPDRLRIAFLLTDGYVGNEEAILKTIEQERRGARIFTLGVGSSVNRYLLDRAATVGRGEAFYVRQDEDAGEVIERFFRRVDRPALAHVKIDWNGIDVTDLTPARVPDLWQGQPIKVHGRYRQGGPAEIRIQGRLGKQPYAKHLAVDFPQHQPDNALMASVWARAKVKELMLEMARKGQTEERVEQVTKLGLEYKLMTRWTSFVAVEEKVVNVDGKQKTVVQPVELPEGVSYEGVFGDTERPVQEGMSMRALMAPATMLREMQARPPGQPGPNLIGSMASAGDTRGDALDERCRWNALSVSGGLRYAEVARQLKAARPDLCHALQGKQSGEVVVRVLLMVAADGRVSGVVLEPRAKLSEALERALREELGRLRFGPVAGGGTARIKLRLMLR
jgi:Ca-activated chloride channel family protein